MCLFTTGIGTTAVLGLGGCKQKTIVGCGFISCRRITMPIICGTSVFLFAWFGGLVAGFAELGTVRMHCPMGD